MKICQDRFPSLPDRIGGLVDLAFNLWWGWHPEARELFKSISRGAWKQSVHNPVKMLNLLDSETLDRAAQNPAFLRHYDSVMSRFRESVDRGSGWFTENVADPGMLPIAYFSAEYGLHRSLPFYAGGLGFLAGDFLKEASDLAVPLVALGFMYPGGYFRQRISTDGWQTDDSEPMDRANAPICRVLDDEGRRLIIKVPVIDPPIYVEVWKVVVGRVPLYLIDTDIEANDPWHRGITSRLYIGDIEQRLRQEIVLGIGGTEVMNALGIKHSILHLNEGHPAFALLERIRERVASGMGFGPALDDVRATSVFTTHTPVPAGHDVYPYQLMEKYFSSYIPSLGIDREEFHRLGQSPADPAAGFNMTAFALKCSAFRNAVSRRHCEVARRMWQSLWPDKAENDVPVTHITNGVHVPTWVDPKVRMLFDKHLGNYWVSGHDNPEVWGLVDDIPDAELWDTHNRLKTKLLFRILDWSRGKWMEESTDPRAVVASGVFLDPGVLTIGFARRFATYKRAGLLFRQPDRLRKILNDRWRPVQIIFAGKAHPDDDPGKRLLQEVFNAARDPSYGGRIAFVEDYGEQLAQYLVHGVDVWLNNPTPPLEACGTSGMKASINGVPHLSVPDGWWVEAYNGKNGWNIESAGGASGDDDADADALYRLIEEALVPLYYDVGDDGVPHGWIAIMKEAIKTAGRGFSARRMLKEYSGLFYRGALGSASSSGGR